MSSPQSAVPAANSPQLLTRLLETVARGVRSNRGLQESLGLSSRTVQYYTRAAEWLGLLTESRECTLTTLGLEYVYAGRRRPQVYAAAVWSNPLAAELLSQDEGRLPELDAIAAAIASGEPELSPATVRRRASAVRSLIAPAVGRARSRVPDQAGQQLSLPLALQAASPAPPRVELVTGKERNPDLYRHLWASLLDFGELSMGQIRALLDRSGADEVPMGGYIDMAITRGDAERVGERLVSTADGVRRRELVETTTSLMLSDPGYRAYLAAFVSAAGDRPTEIRRDELASRFRGWDRRLFGRVVAPEEIGAALEGILLDRPLGSFPVAKKELPALRPVHAAFLDVWDQPGLALCLPPSMVELQGGVSAINRLLAVARRQGDVGPPHLADRPVVYHGGILHPGEVLPRSVPDTRTLRLRVVMHSPYAALATALLLLHRHSTVRIEVTRDDGGWSLSVGRKKLGELLQTLDDFAQTRAWVACRRRAGEPGAATLVAALTALGVVSVIGRRAVLDERFFTMLGTEVEELELRDRLLPLADTLEAFLLTAAEGPA